MLSKDILMIPLRGPQQKVRYLERGDSQKGAESLIPRGGGEAPHRKIRPPPPPYLI
jgi:hypothetical protein